MVNPNQDLSGNWTTTTTTYPGLLAGLQPLYPIPPAQQQMVSEHNTAMAMILELQEELKKKTHMDVSKNQEERIVELESIVTELMEEREERKREDAAKKVREASTDSQKLYEALSGVSSSSASVMTRAFATQSIPNGPSADEIKYIMQMKEQEAQVAMEQRAKQSAIADISAKHWSKMFKTKKFGELSTSFDGSEGDS